MQLGLTQGTVIKVDILLWLLFAVNRHILINLGTILRCIAHTILKNIAILSRNMSGPPRQLQPSCVSCVTENMRAVTPGTYQCVQSWPMSSRDVFRD